MSVEDGYDLHMMTPAGGGEDGAFSGGVVEQARAPNVGVYGGVVDDSTAAREMRVRVFGHVEVWVDPLASADWRVSRGLIVIVGR